MDVREQVRTRPMRPFQYLVVALCIVITMVDGYEILIMAFVAPHIVADWGIDSIQVGYLLSAGVAGMAIGAVVVSPFADRVGRRNHIVMCLFFVVIGMALSGLAQNVPQMIGFRFFAGLFLGGIVASINTIVAEFSNDKRRGTIMGVYGVGFPLGVAVGGVVTTPLVNAFGWRGPFFAAAAVTLLLMLIIMAVMPESVDFLLEKRPKKALEKYNLLARRLGLAAAETLPPSRSSSEVRKSPIGAMFRGITFRRTLILWLGFGSLQAAFYFANTWTASLVSEATGDPATGVTAGVLIAVGGVIGALVFAVLSLVVRPRIATAIIMFSGVAAYILYANNFDNLGRAMVLAVFVGLAANGGIAAYYAISPFIFPAAIRGTAIGLMLGVGRGVSILSPILAGFLFDAGWTAADAYQLFGVIIGVAGIAALLLDWSYRGRSEDPENPELREDEADQQYRSEVGAPASEQE